MEQRRSVGAAGVGVDGGHPRHALRLVLGAHENGAARVGALEPVLVGVALLLHLRHDAHIVEVDQLALQ